MKTYEIIIDEKSEYVKTNAEQHQVELALSFVSQGAEPDMDKVLQALRTLGAKATHIKLDPVKTFTL